ncbi:hypothetical protein AKO1_006174 [Acrasis kona]|uniref:Uncharacterized protein n=1 Tax=Acrasis kona TaxID=1008807 RepID=A0AAW2YJ40_9EUKA
MNQCPRKDSIDGFFRTPYPYIIIAGIGLFEFALNKLAARSREKYNLSFDKIMSELVMPEHWTNKTHVHRYEPESYNNSSITFTFYEEVNSKVDGEASSHENLISEFDALREEETLLTLDLAQLHNSTVKVFIGFDAEEFNDYDWKILEAFLIKNSRLPVDLYTIKMNLQSLL